MKQAKKITTAQDLLFEIGTEELPATNLADIFESAAAESTENVLKIKWKKLLEDNRITFESAEVWATPRRLVFFAKAVAASQTSRDQLTKLMAQAEAYGPEGRPTEKFLTILKHRNTDVSETIVSDFNGKPFVFIKKAEPVRKTLSVLPDILENFVPTLGFPKNMKWDDSGLFFPRPIRSTLCFLGSQAVRYKVGAVRSTEKLNIFSKGRRIAFSVTDPASYFKTLKAQDILLEPVERKKTIQSALDKLARSLGGKLNEDPFLLSEVNFLVENPQAFAAPFDAQFLKLPREVLTVSMARKQRIFGLVDNAGNVLPKFLAITDRPLNEKERKQISLNYEKILHAKLQDSLFFYREDVKVPLSKKREELKTLIFLKNAGSMLEKSERLVTLSKEWGKTLSLPAPTLTALERACYLSKADLLTQMVGEFPELQGIIGKYYALENGESAETANAIGEQYLPRTVQDRLPESLAGSLLSLLDKCDLIAACFLLGLEPTSSLDPYALRRSASAVGKIILEKKLSFSFSALLEQTRKQLLAHTRLSEEQKQKATPERLAAFFKERFKAHLVDRGFREDLVAAVLNSDADDLYHAYLRLTCLSKITRQERFTQACKVVERTHNILKGQKEALPSEVDRALFAEPLEEEVFKRYEQYLAPIREAKSSEDFERVTSLYAEAFFDILNQFFDKVFINAEDLKVRKNRHLLLRNVKELYTRDVADLSKIQTAIEAKVIHENME